MNKHAPRIIFLSLILGLSGSGRLLSSIRFGLPSAVKSRVEELEEKHAEEAARRSVTETRILGTMNPLDIADARALVIAPGSAGAQGFFSFDLGEPVSTLFKITDDGTSVEYKEVTYTRTETVRIENEAGEIEEREEEIDITQTVYPVAIVDLDENYFIACFDEEGDLGIIEHNYLVRKNDGAVFVMPDSRPLTGTLQHIYMNMFANEDFSDFIQTDAEGNIYYLDPVEVNRLNIDDPGNITHQPLTQASNIHERGVYNYRVNNAGHIKYFYQGGNNLALRIRYNSDPPSLITLPSPGQMATFWRGFDGEIYRESGGNIQRLNVISGDPPGYEFEDVGSLEISDPDTEYVCFEEPYIFKVRDSTQIITVGSYPNGQGDHLLVAEVYGSTRTFRLSDLGISSIGLGISSDRYYYIAGLDLASAPVLIRVDPATYTPGGHHAYETLLSGYDIYRFSVSGDDVVTFNAERLSPQSIVIGRISGPGEDPEVLQEDAPQVHQLIQIQ